LTRIEDRCFSNCSLKSTCILRNVDFIAGTEIKKSRLFQLVR
jgi:hypothetical protein